MTARRWRGNEAARRNARNRYRTFMGGPFGAAALVLSISVALFVLTPHSRAWAATAERSESGFTTIVAPDGSELFQTGLAVERGDRFLDVDDRLYEVTRVRGETADTRLVERVNLEASLQEAFGEYPARGGLFRSLRDLTGEALGAESDAGLIPSGDANRLIGLYHTHSDESYKLNGGKTNEPWEGEIFEVGRAASVRLREYGLDVFHSYNRHDPHDGAAYSRSRRTVADILKKQPDALFDIHRDTPPRDVYTTTVDGETIAQVLIVVGRQNPAMAVNEKLAWALKAHASEREPELVRGIFYARGNYNQDLFPRALLLEVGTTTNSLEEAQRGIRHFSDLLPAVLYGQTAPLPEGATERQGEAASPNATSAAQDLRAREGQAGWQTAVLLAAGAIVLGLAFLLLNESRYAEVTKRLDDMIRRARSFIIRRIPRRVK